MSKEIYSRYRFWRKFSSFGTSRATMRLMPKIFTKIKWKDSWGMLRSRTISRQLEWQLSGTISLTFLMFLSFEEVDPEWGISSRISRLSVNALYHTQNLSQTLYSIISLIVKFMINYVSRLNQQPAINKQVDRSRSLLTQ